MEENISHSLAHADPKGRFDVGLYRLAKLFTERAIEPRMNNLPIFANGLGDVIEHAIQRNVPSKSFSAVDIATALGIFPKVQEKPNRGRKRGRK